MVDTPWPHLLDVSLVYTLTENWCDRHYPLIPYRLLTIHDEYTDAIHDEILAGDKEWAADVNLRAFMVPSTQAFALTHFAIDEMRDVVLQACVPSLVTAGLGTQDITTRVVTITAKTGDRFTYTDGIEYEIYTWKIGSVWGNTDVPIFYAATATKVRRVATAYE